MTLNKTMLIGRLVRDPELKYTASGIAVSKFTLAVERAFKNAQGEKESDFIQCIAWKKQAENLANYMKKGSRILVEGRIQTGKYEKDDGTTVFTTDVVADNIQFLEYRQPQQGNPQQQNTQQQPKFEVNEQDLPF